MLLNRLPQYHVLIKLSFAFGGLLLLKEKVGLTPRHIPLRGRHIQVVTSRNFWVSPVLTNLDGTLLLGDYLTSSGLGTPHFYPTLGNGPIVPISVRLISRLFGLWKLNITDLRLLRPHERVRRTVVRLFQGFLGPVRCTGCISRGLRLASQPR